MISSHCSVRSTHYYRRLGRFVGTAYDRPSKIRHIQRRFRPNYFLRPRHCPQRSWYRRLLSGFGAQSTQLKPVARAVAKVEVGHCHLTRFSQADVEYGMVYWLRMRMGGSQMEMVQRMHRWDWCYKNLLPENQKQIF